MSGLMRSVRRRVLVPLVATLVMGGAAVTTAQPASAWAWSSTVTVKGTACGGGGPNTATVSAVLNNQRAYSPESYAAMPPPYSLTFTNVPSGGGWAWAWVTCSVQPNYGKWIWVYRPAFGSTLYVNL